jgi:hypothetical protein
MTQEGPPLEPEVVAAVDATSAAYTQDAGLDVSARLREELERRGQPVDEETVGRLARLVRAGHVDDAQGLGIDPT